MAVSVQVQAVCLSKVVGLLNTTLVFGLSGSQNGVTKTVSLQEGDMFAVNESYLITVS